LFALRPSWRFTELAFALEDSNPNPAALRGVSRQVAASPGPKLVVTHTAGSLVFPHANTNLFRALRGHLHLVETVTGRDRTPIFVVYAYR
jgi:hypothetical protein